MKPKLFLSLAAFAIMSMTAMAEPANVQTYTFPTPYQVEKIAPPKGGGKVKNVILMIGDGMSLMHIEAAWTCNRGHLWLENAQYTGISKTPASNRLITDSGSGGTSLATGYKTRYHAVGVDSTGRPLESLNVLAHKAGKANGIAVTCRFWDATPCDFVAHNLDRNKEQDLILDYLNAPLDYVFGGGAKYFEHRDDGRNIFSELEKKGYRVARTLDELWHCKSGKIYAVPYPVDTPVPAERGDLLVECIVSIADSTRRCLHGSYCGLLVKRLHCVPQAATYSNSHRTAAGLQSVLRYRHAKAHGNRHGYRINRAD